jgi:hypothetical protein
MRSGVCPRCNGDEVYGSQQGLPLAGGHQVTLQAHVDEGFRGIRPWHRTTGLFEYVCAGCGYVEVHLLDPDAIAFVRRNWVRVVRRDA